MALTSDPDAISKAVATPTAPQRSLAYFADLNPADNTKFIEARLSQIDSHKSTKPYSHRFLMHT